MRVKHAIPVLVKRYLNPQVRKRAMFMLGGAGVGKSEIVFQASDILGTNVPNWNGVTDLRLSQMEPTDLRGIPAVDMARKVAEWFRFDLLPQDGAGIIFLDELTSAPAMLQAAAYQLVLTPQDFGVPDTYMIVAAGNRQSDRGVTYTMASPLINRFNYLSIENPLDEWLEYAVKKDVRLEVTSFLKTRPDLLNKPIVTGEPGQFPSHRSWFAVNDSLELELPDAVRTEIFCGDVGEEAGTAFEAHCRVADRMPDIRDILDGKDVAVPDELDMVYCIAMGLAAQIDKDNFVNAWSYLKQCPGDVGTLTVKLAYKRDKDIAHSPAYVEWAHKNRKAFEA